MLFLATSFESAISQIVTNNGSHQLEYTKEPFDKQFLQNRMKRQLKLTAKDKEGKKDQKSDQKYGCSDGTTILTQNKLPIKGACVLPGYDKRLAPGGGGNDTTVINDITHIKFLDVNQADNTIYTYLRLYYQWEDDRISVSFPNNKPQILIARVSSDDN